MTRGEAVHWLINITADIGKAGHRELWHYEQALSEIRDMLEGESERKKGKWQRHIFDGTMGRRPSAWMCDNCNGLNIYKTDFCPNCGADMREEGGE